MSDEQAKANDGTVPMESFHLPDGGVVYGRAVTLERLRALLAGPPDQPCRECEAVSAAIGGVEFMDPPDGGDVSLSEQVRRMRAKIGAGPPSEGEVFNLLCEKIAYDQRGDISESLEDAARAVLALFRSRING